MKIVQSTWFNTTDHIKGNWPETKFALFSIALSYHLLRKQGRPLQLNTNSVGFNLVIEQMGLAYDEVSLCLERNSIDPIIRPFFDQYWVLNKLYAYSLQDQPFVHVDNDVFLYKKLDIAWEKATLLAQNQEIELPYYTVCLEQVRQCFTYIPAYVPVDTRSPVAVNVGIIGGRAFTFFRLAYDEIITFLTRNLTHLNELSAGYAEIFLEQYLLKCIADWHHLPFRYILNQTIDATKTYGVNRFHLVPDKLDYLHVMNYKANPTICESVARLLYFENRTLYHHCLQVAQSLQTIAAKPKKIPIICDSSTQVKHFFYRTVALIDQLTDDSASFQSSDHLAQFIQAMSGDLSEQQYAVLQDAYQYELVRHQFANALDTQFMARFYRQFCDTQDKIRSGDWLHGTVTCTNFVCLITSRWYWTQTNEFTKGTPRNYLVNLTEQPHSFTTLLSFYPEQKSLKEEPLDSIDAYMVKATNESISVQELIVRLKRSLTDQKQTTILDELLTARIRYFLFQGAFSIQL